MTGVGRSYEGKKRMSINGYRCEAWNYCDTRPQICDSRSPYASLGSHNHCRNPGPPEHGVDDSGGPWCYIRPDLDIEWDYCDIRPCEDGCDKGDKLSFN